MAFSFLVFWFFFLLPQGCFSYTVLLWPVSNELFICHGRSLLLCPSSSTHQLIWIPGAIKSQHAAVPLVAGPPGKGVGQKRTGRIRTMGLRRLGEGWEEKEKQGQDSVKVCKSTGDQGHTTGVKVLP